jgi:hypothetical protein
MPNNISKPTFIFSMIIVSLVTYIITREFSFRANRESQGAETAPFKSSGDSASAANVVSKAKAPTGKDGNEADPYEKEQVKNTIIKNAKKIQECYNGWLESKPTDPKANVKIDWTILPDGKVREPQVVESNALVMNDCLVKKVGELEFPPPPEGKSFYVAHKFAFNTEENLEKLRKEREVMEKKFNPLKKDTQ